MPMILSLVLAAQTVTLTSDPLEAPLVCAVALTLTQSDKPLLFRAATFSHLLSKRAAINTAGGPFFQQLQNLNSNGPVFPKDITPAQAAQLAPQCDKRYPQARRDGPVRLPGDPVTRDAVCLFSLSTMAGAAGSMKDGDPAISTRYLDASQRFAKRYDTGVKAKGLSEDAQLALATRQVVGGLDLGNAYIVSEACLKLPQPS